jgi:hypothetical protein
VAPAPANPPAPAPANPPAAPDAAPGPAGPATAPPAADPLAAPPAVDPNAPAPPPVDPNAGRINNPVGEFSFVLPAGWVESDATHLDYGSALLSKIAGAPSPGQPPPVANDTRVVLGKLDQKLYASAEPDNTKAATRLASDMGEFFMPYPGTRVNQETTALTAKAMSGGASYYEVKFSDASKPNGQIWAAVVGPSGPNVPPAVANQRWFVVWLGTGNDPVDKAGAKTLAESVLPLLAPPAAPGPAPGAPAAGGASSRTRSGRTGPGTRYGRTSSRTRSGRTCSRTRSGRTGPGSCAGSSTSPCAGGAADTRTARRWERPGSGTGCGLDVGQSGIGAVKSNMRGRAHDSLR